MAKVKITLHLPYDVESQIINESSGDSVRKAIYDALNGQHCVAGVEYELNPNSRGLTVMNFRLEGLGLPSQIYHEFDRQPPPGVVWDGFRAPIQDK